MADVHTKEVRSYNMSQIRSKNTKPELVVRKFLFAMKDVNIGVPAFEP
jgi:DNA mismatch endonuclease, patch repair protein